MDDSMEVTESCAGGGSMQGVSLDLEAYAANYSGHTKLNRLLFIAEISENHALEAYRLALEELKKTTNTQKYQEVCARCVERFGETWRADTAWVNDVERKAAHQLEKLEVELKTYKTNFIKESCRMGHNDLGAFYYDRGDLQNALKHYIRTRDYCATSKHIVTMCLNVIKISIELRQSVNVLNFVTKAENTGEVAADLVVVAKLKAVSGLVQLDSQKYKIAARKFLETTIDIQNNYADVIAPQDIAVYGGLCALATFSREELKAKLIDNAAFRNLLELAPEMRELVNDFYGSNYKACLEFLNKMKTDWSMDLYLNPHVDALFGMIREKAVVQYFSPFLTVDMRVMADAFSTDLPGLEKEISRLIDSGAVAARIDSQNKVLHARSVDKRNMTFSRALLIGDEYLTEVKAMILRMNMVSENLIVSLPNRGPMGGDMMWEGAAGPSGLRDRDDRRSSEFVSFRRAK